MVTSSILIVELRYFGSHRSKIFENVGLKTFGTTLAPVLGRKLLDQPSLALLTIMLCLFRLELLFGYTWHYMHDLAYLPWLTYPFAVIWFNILNIAHFHHRYPHSLYVCTSFLGFVLYSYLFIVLNSTNIPATCLQLLQRSDPLAQCYINLILINNFHTLLIHRAMLD